MQFLFELLFQTIQILMKYRYMGKNKNRQINIYNILQVIRPVFILQYV